MKQAVINCSVTTKVLVVGKLCHRKHLMSQYDRDNIASTSVQDRAGFSSRSVWIVFDKIFVSLLCGAQILLC